jgi:hypothetical protein
LIGYALAQPEAALPCPDLTQPLGSYTPNDGIEDIDVTTGNCARAEGNVPWATLGVTMTDPWGNRFRYRVTPGMAQRSPALSFSLSSPNGDLELQCLASTESALSTCSPGQLISAPADTRNAVVAVILSHGPNGWGAISSHSNSLNLPPGCTDVPSCVGGISGNERENADEDAAFVSRERTSPTSTVGEFDDLVMWVSPHTLKHRLVGAGKLP